MIRTHAPHPMDSSRECCVLLSTFSNGKESTLSAKIILPIPLRDLILGIEHVQSIVFEGALSVALFSKSKTKIIEGQDDVIAESCEMILNGQSDPDFIRSIELKTGKNLRDQLTIEEIEEIAETARLHRLGLRRN